MRKAAGCGGTPSPLDVYSGVYRFFVADTNRTINAAYAREGPNGTWQYVVASMMTKPVGRRFQHVCFVNGVQQGSGPVLTKGLNTTTSQ